MHFSLSGSKKTPLPSFSGPSLQKKKEKGNPNKLTLQTPEHPRNLHKAPRPPMHKQQRYRLLPIHTLANLMQEMYAQLPKPVYFDSRFEVWEFVECCFLGAPGVGVEPVGDEAFGFGAEEQKIRSELSLRREAECWEV